MKNKVEKHSLAIFLAYFILYSLPAFSQDIKTVKLSANRPLAIRGQDYYISGVIDNRVNQENIGVIKKDFSQDSLQIRFKNGFQGQMNEFISILMPKRSRLQPLLLQVNDLEISKQEGTDMMTAIISHTGLNIDFLRPTDSLSYANITIGITKQGLGANLVQNITKAFEQGFIEFTKVNWQKESPIKPKRIEKWDFQQMPARATFTSWYELKYNRPNLKENFVIKYDSQAQYPHYRAFDKRGRKKIDKGLFAFSNGEAIYLNALYYGRGENYFVKSKTRGRYLLFTDHFAGNFVEFSFGLIGSAIAQKEQGIILDTQTGVITILNKRNIQTILKGFPNILEPFLDSKKKHADMILAIQSLNDQL